MPPPMSSKGVTLDDFRAYMPAHVYIYMPCCEPWPAASVDARLPPIALPKRGNGKLKTMLASKWLDQNRAVEQMTWCPGQPKLITNRLVVDGGWIEREDVTCFNLYRDGESLIWEDPNSHTRFSSNVIKGKAVPW